MKKILIYLISFITICFILPAIFTNRTAKTSTNDIGEEKTTDKSSGETVIETTKNTSTSEYEYQKYGTINLLHTSTGEVEQVKIDDYLCNVVSAEMPADFDNKALEAQAIVARTYTVFKILNKKHQNADICDSSTCCQAWISKEDRLSRWTEDKRESNWEKISKAVKNTAGKIITYNNQPINAFFHSNSGGITEIPVNVWGGTGYPYLQSVETSGSKRVKTVKFGNHQISGVEARTILGLKSTNFEISKNNGKIKFSVKGYGHGVGMSQTGADAMAKQGSSAEEIIKHFYTGVEIKDINSL